MRMSSRYIDPSIDSLDELPTAADKYPYSTAADTWTEGTITAAGRALLDDANAAAQLTTLGVTAAAQTILDDASVSAILTTIGGAALASPTFTGTPAAPAPAAGTSTTQIATTAFVTTTHGHRYQIPATWYVVNIARNLTDTDIARDKADAGFADTWPAPRAGSIVALTTRLAVAVIDGTITVKVAKNGTAGTLSVVSTSGSNASGGTSTQATGVDTYAAADMIGCEITTDGSLLPNGTDDIEVWIEVQEAGT